MVVKLTCDIWFQKGEKRPVGLGQPFRYDEGRAFWPAKSLVGVPAGRGAGGAGSACWRSPWGVFGLCSSAGALQTTGP